MTLGIAANLLVAVLLVVAIGWALVLDRRLRALRSGKDGVRDSVAEFAGAAVRAEAAVAALRQAAERSVAELAGQQARARAASEELSLLVGAAEGLAERLTARAAAAVRPVPRADLVRELSGAR